MDSNNPYQAPSAAVAEAPTDTGRPLFRATGVYIATFMGSILAGGWVLAMNHDALGQHALARKARWAGLIGTIAIIGLSLALPERVPGMVYVIPQIVAASFWLKTTPQGDAIAARLAAGSPMRSNWAAAGIGLLAMIALLAIGALIAAVAVYGFGAQL